MEELAANWPALEKPPVTWDHSVRGAVAMAAASAMETRDGDPARSRPREYVKVPAGTVWGLPQIAPALGWPWVGRLRVTHMQWMRGCTGFNDSTLVAVELPSEMGIRYPLTLLTVPLDDDVPRDLPRMLHGIDIAKLAQVAPSASKPVADGACVSIEGFPYVVANEGIMGYAVYSLAVTSLTPVPDAQCGAAR